MILANIVDLRGTLYTPLLNGSNWEFAPYEFGAWDSGIAAFAQTAFLGSSLSNGAPLNGSCITNYDNLAFVIGASSTLFNDPTLGAGDDILLSNFRQSAATSTSTTDSLFAKFSTDVNALLVEIPTITFAFPTDLFATWPHSFYNLSSAPLVSARRNLALVDGEEAQ